MPGADGGRGRRDTNQGGGTSVARERPSRWSAAALVIAVIAVVAGVIALVVTRGAAHHTVAEPTTAAPVAPVPVAARARVEPEAVAPDSPPPPDPWPILDRLERTAAGERLYVKSTTRGAVVELRSSFCAEARLQALVDAALPALRDQRVARVSCVEPHGAVVFVRTL